MPFKNYELDIQIDNNLSEVTTWLSTHLVNAQPCVR